MKDYLKMSDVFNRCDVVETDVKVLFAVSQVYDDGVMCHEYAHHAIESHDELVAMSKELLAEIKMIAKAYVNLLESGKDRIESLGGDCDDVAYMAAHDASLVHTCSVIGKYEGALV